MELLTLHLTFNKNVIVVKLKTFLSSTLLEIIKDSKVYSLALVSAMQSFCSYIVHHLEICLLETLAHLSSSQCIYKMVNF